MTELPHPPTADALRWLRDEVVRRMNEGVDEAEILADGTYPDEHFDQPRMGPLYGAPDYIVRDLYREERHATSLPYMHICITRT